MSVLESTPFDDPALKAALRTLCAGEKAPPALAERIRQQCAAQSGDGTSMGIAAATDAGDIAGRIETPRTPAYASETLRAGRIFRAVPFYGRVAAAMILLSVALIGLQIRQSPPVQAASAPLPDTLAAALVERHDLCCRVGNGHRASDIPQNDFAGMERVFHRELKCRVMVADLAPDGWKFRGAARCAVGQGANAVASAHLIYDRDGSSISIFSLPAKVFPHASDGMHFATVYERHPIVGIVANGAVFCMVQSQPGQTPSLNHLQELFKEHEAESSVAAAPDAPAAAKSGVARLSEHSRSGELMHELSETSLARR